MPTAPPSPAQAKVLTVFRAYMAEYSRSPTLQELASNLGTSKATVHGHVDALIAKGWMERTTKHAACNLRPVVHENAEEIAAAARAVVADAKACKDGDQRPTA